MTGKTQTHTKLQIKPLVEANNHNDIVVSFSIMLLNKANESSETLKQEKKGF